jgi:hypothetical protein
MRQIVLPLLVIGCFASALPPQAVSAGKSAVGACSLLTKDLVMKITPYEKQALDRVAQIPPSEEPVGPSGSACEYGGIYLQIDPFASPTRLEEDGFVKWLPLPGIGDVAYFRDNVGEWAELYVRAGAHVFTIQMDVPTGRTAESIKPNVIALAQAILPKLR